MRLRVLVHLLSQVTLVADLLHDLAHPLLSDGNFRRKSSTRAESVPGPLVQILLKDRFF